MAVLSIIETYSFHDGGPEGASLFIASVDPQSGALLDSNLSRPESSSRITGRFDAATGQITFHEASAVGVPFGFLATFYTGFAIPGNGFGEVLALAGTWQRLEFTITLDRPESPPAMEVVHGGWYADNHQRLAD